MNANRRTTAAGVFDNRAQAERAVEELRRAGFGDDRIGVLARNEPTTDPSGTLVEEGAATGAMGGAALGVLAGLAVAAGALTPLGPAIAGGALIGLLASTAAGAATGGLIGALVGLGFPEEEARYYEGELGAGRVLVTVLADGRYDEAVAILLRCGARDTADRTAEVPPVMVM